MVIYLRWPALTVASLDAVIAPVARLTALLSDGFLRAVILGSAGLLAIIFIRVLFDPDIRRAVNEANKEMQGDRPFRLRWITPWNPTWGLFGSRMGGRYLASLRVVLTAEFFLALLANGADRPNPSLLIAATAFGITILLTLAQLKQHYPSANPAARA